MGPGERIVVGPIDLAALRLERKRRLRHHMLSQLRTKLYQGYSEAIHPRAESSRNWPISTEGNKWSIDSAKRNRKRQ